MKLNENCKQRSDDGSSRTAAAVKAYDNTFISDTDREEKESFDAYKIEFEEEEEFSDSSKPETLDTRIGEQSCFLPHTENISLQENFCGFDDPVVTSNNSLGLLTTFPNSNQSRTSFLEPTIMATPEQKRQFIGSWAPLFRENYNGDPLALDSFIDKIELVEGCIDPDLVPTFILLVKSKLEGKAREAIPTNITSIQEIKDALKSRIKPDNSKVVAGKIASLKVTNNNLTEFAKRVEELSDALERSLIIGGISKDKAHEMAVEQSVNVCRLNTRSDLVKSILASTSFSDAKDVVAKMIVEQNNQATERQVLAFRSRFNNQPNFRNNNRGNNYYNNNNRYNNNSNFNRFKNNNNFNRYNNNNNARYNNNNQNRQNNNYRQNNDNRNNSNSRNTSNSQNRLENRTNTNAGSSNTRNNANVRSLNLDAPQQRTLRDEEINE
ncbi:putative mediator of RNA polymerase II transcription subunit 29 [Eurosta solidaginis]|uniref:putative mediator of RNA polymerase II transcription subunit 29 n=1 Tax=Eurosta solidaginis TaxID=178769 RepID=UPI0035315405